MQNTTIQMISLTRRQRRFLHYYIYKRTEKDIPKIIPIFQHETFNGRVFCVLNFLYDNLDMVTRFSNKY